MVRVRSLVYSLFLLGGAFAAAAAAEPLTLAEAVRLAEENNPDLRTLAAEVDAARALLRGASLLLQANPSLTASAGPRRSEAGDSRDSGVQLVQDFEVAGQRGARIGAAEANVDAAQARLEARRVELLAEVRERFGAALAATQRLDLATETLATARESLEAAEQRFAAGATALLEVNTARIEFGRLTREKAQAEGRQATARGELALVVGLDPRQPLDEQGELGLTSSLLTADQAGRLALERRGELRAARRTLDAAKAEARLAERARFPNLRLGASYAREEESDATVVQGIVGIDLPLFNRNSAARGVAAARVRQQEIALASTERRIHQEVVVAVARVRAARDAADGYAADVVEAMEQNMELATESHRAGKIDFLQLMVVRRQALDARAEYVDILEELDAASARLDRAVGQEP